MKKIIYLGYLIILTITTNCTQDKNMNYNKLNSEEERVIVHKGTEPPFSGKFNNHRENGTYVCRRCNAPLYNSSAKFQSTCGWPSFDDEIPNAVKRIPDSDRKRTEIICANCNAHLGHVFVGEQLTQKNVRHCVNSISLDFIPAPMPARTDTAIFAGGCFWGIEYYFKEVKGVVSTKVGFTGGKKDEPTYKDVCNTNTGHAEAIEITYDPGTVSYEELAKLFFQIHDPTQLDKQGPDIGNQYRSEIFYLNEEQKQTAEKLVGILKSKGYKVVTKITKADKFWEAEDYHQDYYNKTGAKPYCHRFIKRFDD